MEKHDRKTSITRMKENIKKYLLIFVLSVHCQCVLNEVASDTIDTQTCMLYIHIYICRSGNNESQTGKKKKNTNIKRISFSSLSAHSTRPQSIHNSYSWYNNIWSDIFYDHSLCIFLWPSLFVQLRAT